MLPELSIYRGAQAVADGDPLGAGLCESLEVNGVALLDVVTLLFAAGPRVFDREGRTNTLTFRILTVAPDARTGMDAALRGPLELCGVADLALAWTDGETPATWTAAGAAWRAVRSTDATGDACTLTYEVLCGPLVYQSIAPADLIDGGDDAAPFVVDDDVDGGGFLDDDAAAVALIDGGEDS